LIESLFPLGGLAFFLIRSPFYFADGSHFPPTVD
jgi:hypothetical protein